jgi:acyl-CoA thioester hydrolase
MERARTEWLRSLGIEQDRLLNEERRYFVVVDTCAKFVKSARLKERLIATARLAKVTRATF